MQWINMDSAGYEGLFYGMGISSFDFGPVGMLEIG